MGGVSALVQFAVLWAASRRWPAEITFTVSFGCATSTHYALNRFWALPSERHDAGRQFAEYLATVGVSYLINLGAFKLGYEGLGLSVMWSAFWAVPSSTLVVFLLLNYRVFRSRRG
ncbi:MAG: GtrA family protein [Lacunisphaera sp.]